MMMMMMWCVYVCVYVCMYVQSSTIFVHSKLPRQVLQGLSMFGTHSSPVYARRL